MSPMRCADCERNVSLEVEAEIEETRYDDSDARVEVDIHMIFTCAECGSELGEYSDSTDSVIQKLEDYLEKHEDLDPGDVEVDDAEVVTAIKQRNGRKTYIAEWSTQAKLNNKVFKVNGELGVTQDQIG